MMTGFAKYRELVFANYPHGEIVGSGEDWFAFRQAGSGLVITVFDEGGAIAEFMEPPIWWLN